MKLLSAATVLVALITQARAVETEPVPTPGARFQECSDCPLMTVIAAGHYVMTRKVARDGRKDEDPEGLPKTRPARQVIIEKAFALGSYPVTRGEFAVFVRETNWTIQRGCHVQREGGVWVLDKSKDWRLPGFTQTERDPVVCISWNDAQDYIQWLNGKLRGSKLQNTLGPYHLPTWEEMEYAAGANTTSAYYWGEYALRDQANYGREDCLPCRPSAEGADRWPYTSPVGSFPANPFGLYDMAGNVWQWMLGCTADPSAAPPKICQRQMLHGGSWLTNPEYLRTGEYSSADIRHRNNEIGFRVARALN